MCEVSVEVRERWARENEQVIAHWRARGLRVLLTPDAPITSHREAFVISGVTKRSGAFRLLCYTERTYYGTHIAWCQDIPGDFQEDASRSMAQCDLATWVTWNIELEGLPEDLTPIPEGLPEVSANSHEPNWNKPLPHLFLLCPAIVEQVREQHDSAGRLLGGT